MLTTAPPAESDAQGTTAAADEQFAPRERLMSPTFIGLLLTQFLGATNDNILRWLVIGIGKEHFVAQGHPERISAVLAAGSACLVLPYLLLAAPAGYLADRFSKRDVIIRCKFAEVVIAFAAVIAILIGNIYVLFFVVALIGAQAALFGPSKLGSIPEMLHANKISAANGVIGLTTVIATVAGLVIGNWLSSLEPVGPLGGRRLWLSAAVLLGVAVSGWITSLWIMPLLPANPFRIFPRDMLRQTWRDLKTLAENRAMLRCAFGIMFFWTLAMLANLNIDQYAFEGGATEQTQVSPMLGALVFGVGLGSVLAGVWSGGKVELGILPLGAGGLAIFSFCLFTVQGELVNSEPDYTFSYVAACVFLFLLGCSAGLFDVPLAAYMQHRSPPEHRGAILAANNFLTFGGMLLATIGYWLLRLPTADQSPWLSSRAIFMLCGLATIPVFIYIVVLIPQATIKFLAWLTTHTVYRIRLYGRENLPAEGGALLVPNHISWVDGLLLFATSSRQVRMLIDHTIISTWWRRGFAKIMGAIPIGPSPKVARRAIETAREALRSGELVCIFPEGGISRSGQLQSFKQGVLEIRRGTNVPVIPVYLDELWGSIFSFSGGRFFWKWPTALPRRVSIWFGKPLADPKEIHEVRQAVQDLGADAFAGRKQRTAALPSAMIRNCRKALFRWKVADSSGTQLTGGGLLMRTLILRRLLLRHIFTEEDKCIGLLLPPSVGGLVVNAAVSMAGRRSANLNYTASSEVINTCLRRAGIRKVLTSRQVMDKLNLNLDTEFVYLEDYRDKVKRADKLYGLLGAYATPAFVLDRILDLRRQRGGDVVTIIFTSGSTGVPKGVMLTHHNIASNVEAIELVVCPRRTDTIVGVVPFFHSLGYTVTLWGPLLLDIRVAYHFTPLDARAIAKLVHSLRATFLLATPTFLRSYLRRCEPDELKSLDVVVAGAEKLPVALCEAFEQKFGVRPVEGYGTTELSPLVSVNVPPNRSRTQQIDCKEGSVGRPVPGVSAKVIDPESLQHTNDSKLVPLPPGEAGMLLVKGPNVMKGYLSQEKETKEVIRDGWYVTGDIAEIDTDGFIYITGRLSRFSKIGGEMVPHLRIEDAIQKILGGDKGEIKAVVTSVADERKGERLVVVHTKLEMSPDEICRRLAKTGLPNLWLPGPDSFVEVESIPVLGSGKTDLKAVSDLAKQHFGADRG